MSTDTILLLVGANGFALATMALVGWFMLPASATASVVPEDNVIGLRGVTGSFLKDMVARTVKVGSLEKMQHRLDLAGNPNGWTVERVFAAKMVFMAALMAFGAMVGSSFVPLVSLQGLIIVAGSGAFGFVLPTILVYNMGAKRQDKIRKTLADVLDLLSVSMRAGLGFDAALMRVVLNGSGPLVDEFARMMNEFNMERSREEVFRALLDRTNVADLRHVVQALIQADKMGIPIAQVLTEQGKEMRVKRRQSAEEKAQKIAVKMTVPSILFIFPALIVVVIGPGIIRTMEAFQL
jgi:tight adherence protein C